MLMGLEVRRVADLRPHPEVEPLPMGDWTRAGLKQSMAAGGLLHPLHITPDGKILDGMARWHIARELGLLDVPVLVYRYDDLLEERYHAIAVNLCRVHLSEPEWTAVAADAVEVEVRRQVAQEAQIGSPARWVLLRLAWRWVGTLLPHPAAGVAARWIRDADRNRLKESIANWGILQPLDVTRSGLILDGVLRWQIARELGIGKVPVLVFGGRHANVRKTD